MVRWVIADGYYLYRQKIEVKAESPDLLVLAPQLPKGVMKTDPYLGTQEIYTQQVEVAVPFTRFDCWRPSHANQGDLPGLRGSRPMLSAHHQSGFSGRCHSAGRSRHACPTPGKVMAILGGVLAFLLAGLVLRKGRKLDIPV